jgi:hypothetical protein
MRRFVRIAFGLTVVAALAYAWLPLSQGYGIPLGLLLIGLVGGFLTGSRWSIPLTPAAIMAGSWLLGRVKCADCPSATDPPLGTWLVLMALMLGLAALGAWVGASGARLVVRARPWSKGRVLRSPSDGPGDSSDTP